jgi:undecaprenyl-diphosphatase
MTMAAQILFIQWLQQIRTPFLDSLIKPLDYLDRPEFYFFLIPFVFLGHSWKAGMRLFYILMLSRFINLGLKAIFALPRPFQVDPSLGLINVQGYGFPSGAAQTAILLSGLLILYWKSRWRWLIAICYTLIVSFSRVYLGVHFPMDIAGGWAAGLLLLGIYVYLFPKIETRCEKASPRTNLIVSQALLLVPMLCFPTPNVISSCASAMGLGAGVYTSYQLKIRLEPAKSLTAVLWRGAIGVIGLFAIRGAIASCISPEAVFAQFLEFFSYGLWISLFAWILCSQLSKKV